MAGVAKIDAAISAADSSLSLVICFLHCIKKSQQRVAPLLEMEQPLPD
jgi:hypothetical protein